MDTLGVESDPVAQIITALLRPGLYSRLKARFFAAESEIDRKTLSVTVMLLDAARAA